MDRSSMDRTLVDLVGRLRREFLGMPELALTPQQVAGLWQLDGVTSACVLDFLTARGFLHRMSDGRYTRPSIAGDARLYA